jgi:hypothetical protein
MSSIFEIPLSIGTPQQFSVTLSQVDYLMTLRYRNVIEGGWFLDIADISGNSIVEGIPLVTGVDLLEQYKHLGFTGALRVQTTNDPDAVPTFENLGAAGKLYWVVE